MIGLGSLKVESQAQTQNLLREESCASGMKPQYSEKAPVMVETKSTVVKMSEVPSKDFLDLQKQNTTPGEFSQDEEESI